VRVDTRDLVDQIGEQPGTTGLLFDVDGTLAPIVDRPEDASVPEQTRALLRELAARYALVACVSGRPEDDARRIVGVDGLVYVGEHGLGLDPRAGEWRAQLEEVVAGAGRSAEWKRFSVAFHYRSEKDEQAAIAELREIAKRALELGLRARWGRKVLEVLPPVDVDKGTAVRALLAERELQRGLYAGDDATDLDAFHGLDGLELAVRVAVVSEEGPGELASAADVVVTGTEELGELLRRL
jgi:trehalose 6-phosphate phosphatase